MQIWYFIKWLKRITIYAALWTAQKIVGWFILGRSCSRCWHRAEIWGPDSGVHCNHNRNHVVLCGITKKGFKDEDWYIQE